MFFDMHADVWTDNFWEYQKGNKDVIRNKYKEKKKWENYIYCIVHDKLEKKKKKQGKKIDPADHWVKNKIYKD